MSTTTTDAPAVHVALARVMAAVPAVPKNERNAQQGFNFRGIDATLNAVGPALRTHGVLVLPTVLNEKTQLLDTRSGGRAQHVVLSVRYTFVGPAGDSLTVDVRGEAMDTGDKAYSKAQSVAQRIALLQTLALPTDEKDPDMDVYDMAGGEEPAHQPERQVHDHPAPATSPQGDNRAQWFPALGKARGDVEKLARLRNAAVESGVGDEYISKVDEALGELPPEEVDFEEAIPTADAQALDQLERDALAGGADTIRRMVDALRYYTPQENDRIERMSRAWASAGGSDTSNTEDTGENTPPVV